MTKARTIVTSHIIGSAVNVAALWGMGCGIGNVIAGVAWFASFTPAVLLPAFVAGLVYGLSTMPVYIIINDRGSK